VEKTRCPVFQWEQWDLSSRPVMSQNDDGGDDDDDDCRYYYLL